MAATTENPVIFYDLSSTPGQYWSYNTYKTRLTLSYKKIPYRVQYIGLHEIQSTLKALAIADPSSDPNGRPTYVSDSFEIATYLDERYPAPKYPAVLPIATRPLQKIFVNQYFLSNNLHPLYPFIHPLAIHRFMNQEERENLYQRIGKDYFNLPTEEVAVQKLTEAREKWEELGQAVELNGSTYPFVMGDTVTFADFAISGVLDVLFKLHGEDSKVWKEIVGWQAGRWGRLWKEIQAIEKQGTEIA